MTTTQLSLYNRALRMIGERKLASLTEAREPARALNDVWAEGAINIVLEAGLWNFAMRSTQVLDDPSIQTPFGYSYAFSKPSDFIRTAAVAADEYFRIPLNTMVDEAGYWFSDTTPIYVRYVSNDAAYGSNLALWPSSFMDYVATYLASEVCWQVTKKKDLTDRIKDEDLPRALGIAQSNDGMNEPTKFPPQGSWVTARAGRVNPMRSLWNGSFTGGQ